MMTTFTFDTSVPAANNAPKNDQPIMQINNASTSGLIAVDHVGFNFPNGGYHNIIHQTPQSDPVSIPSIGQLYSKLLSGNTQLFYESSNGVITQLTGPNATLAASDGYTWIPGGILIQWGQVIQSFSSGSTTGTTNFPLAFPNGSFIVTGNPLVSFASLPSSQASVNIRSSTLGGTTSFQWQFYTNSSQYIGFTWFAIGN
jgi:hypothetical protein